MYLRYFLLIITIKDICCYNPKRHVTPITSSSNFKNLKSKPDAVIPARYKITSTTNYKDPGIAQSFPAEFFPQVEYPESIVESSKPFYISSSPFSKDVKSTFNSLAAKDTSKAKASIDYSWPQNLKSKDKLPATSQKVGVNEITDTKGNKINFIDKSTNETLCENVTKVDIQNDTPIDEFPYSDGDMDKLFANLTSIEQSAECKDKDYVVEFINELEQVMKNLTNLEMTEPNKGDYLTIAETPECKDNTTIHAFESEHSDEFKLSLDMTPNNNDSIIELNGDSFLGEEHPKRIRLPLFEDSETNDAFMNVTLSINEYIKNFTSVEDVQSDFCAVANETETSCTES